MVIMLWNVFGWAGLQLTVNMVHHDDELHYCTKSFCYCEVGEGEQICTCHHHDENEDGTQHHSNQNNTEHRFCFYQATHTIPLGTSLELITYQFQAFVAESSLQLYVYHIFDYPFKDIQATPKGFYSNLLRPPIVVFS